MADNKFVMRHVLTRKWEATVIALIDLKEAEKDGENKDPISQVLKVK